MTTLVRDALRDAYAFVAWEKREPMAIVCENVHRVKGLEFDHVILVVHDDTVSDELLYVGLGLGNGDRASGTTGSDRWLSWLSPCSHTVTKNESVTPLVALRSIGDRLSQPG